VERARADLAAGRAWKARDRLVGALSARADDELLGLLGDVHAGMGDPPAAGAAWVGSTRTGPEVDAALAAWRERHGHDPLQLWLSLPTLVREGEAERVRALRAEATQRALDLRGWHPAVLTSLRLPAPPRPTGSRLAVGAGVLAMLLVLASVPVGLWTMLTWIV